MSFNMSIHLKKLVGTSSNHFCNTPSVEGVGTSTLDDRTTQERLKIDLTLETRLVSILISLYCTLFNKLLVTQYTTINFGPSTQVNKTTCLFLREKNKKNHEGQC
jgi:hypothetical protein